VFVAVFLSVAVMMVVGLAVFAAVSGVAEIL
jgi:hypothetical protein